MITETPLSIIVPEAGLTPTMASITLREHGITTNAPAFQAGDGGSIPTCSLHKSDYVVADCTLKQAQEMIREHHYAKGGSNTAVYTHGLYERATGKLVGVAWWLPPTRVAAESVNRAQWKQVLSLTRLACLPCAPKNSESFLIKHSTHLIRKDGRFVSLVTYADESQGHLGGIYLAAGWDFVARTGPYPRWLDANGMQVATLSTKTRTKAQMIALGHRQVGKYHKLKFVKHLFRT
jgi:hypothetical protein